MSSPWGTFHKYYEENRTRNKKIQELKKAIQEGDVDKTQELNRLVGGKTGRTSNVLNECYHVKFRLHNGDNVYAKGNTALEERLVDIIKHRTLKKYGAPCTRVIRSFNDYVRVIIILMDLYHKNNFSAFPISLRRLGTLSHIDNQHHLVDILGVIVSGYRQTSAKYMGKEHALEKAALPDAEVPIITLVHKGSPYTCDHLANIYTFNPEFSELLKMFAPWYQAILDEDPEHDEVYRSYGKELPDENGEIADKEIDGIIIPPHTDTRLEETYSTFLGVKYQDPSEVPTPYFHVSKTCSDIHGVVPDSGIRFEPDGIVLPEPTVPENIQTMIRERERLTKTVVCPVLKISTTPPTPLEKYRARTTIREFMKASRRAHADVTVLDFDEAITSMPDTDSVCRSKIRLLSYFVYYLVDVCGIPDDAIRPGVEETWPQGRLMNAERRKILRLALEQQGYLVPNSLID